MLTITHTHAEGTLITGTSRDDGSGPILRANGWRWGRTISSWYVPHSRDHLPQIYRIQTTRSALEAAGFEVTEDIDSTHRSTADVEADKMIRQEERVGALQAKAERRDSDAEAAWKREEQAVRRLPDNGQPLLVDHYSYGAHLNAIKRADQAMRRAIDAQTEADRAAERAETAAHTTGARYAPQTVANRVDKLAAEIRDRQRRIEGSTRRMYGGVETTPPATGSYRDRLLAELDELRDQHSYWAGILAEHVAAGRIITKDAVKAGDEVQVGDRWYRVLKVNPKSVRVESAPGRSATAPLSVIKARRSAAD